MTTADWTRHVTRKIGRFVPYWKQSQRGHDARLNTNATRCPCDYCKADAVQKAASPKDGDATYCPLRPGRGY